LIQAFINKCIKTSQTLSDEQVRELLSRYLNNNDLDAREKIVKSQTLMVASTARKFALNHRKNEFQDLFQAGLIGLLQAINKFDLSRDARFVNYAKQWVMREIQIVVRKNLHIAYVPITTQREKVFVQTIKHRKDFDDINLLITRIQQKTGISKEMVKEMVQATLTTDISLNTKISATKHNIIPEDHCELMDVIPCPAPNPEELYQETEVSQFIKAALETLKESEERIILAKYFEDKSNEEISSEIKRGIVSMLNLELKTRKKLKKKLAAVKSSR
jgi:RNA polymerase sporulation-specific sigma factor